MRNLLEYPITKEELIEYVEYLQQQLEEETRKEQEKNPLNIRCGDMRGLYFIEMKKAISASDYKFDL